MACYPLCLCLWWPLYSDAAFTSVWCAELHLWLLRTFVVHIVTRMTKPHLCFVRCYSHDYTKPVWCNYGYNKYDFSCFSTPGNGDSMPTPTLARWRVFLSIQFFFFFLWYIVFLFLRRRCPLSSSTTNLLCLPYFVYIRLSSLTKFRNHLRLLCWISSDFIMFLS